ncbi:MAG: MoxR family ATPase [Bacillota bacterium]|nr:MoxR family ATPase [Bacillota bacterium]
MEFNEIKILTDRIKTNISKVIIGKDDTIQLILIALICSGHILLEDIPGVGKTMLAKCLAKSVSCDFKRVQFTPDLLPSDLTGINYYNQKECEFVFRPGPVFTNIVLADEINRATPRTQASLLECMEERQVTVDGDTRVLGRPFFVIATQNPIETQGTFPLPEAQLDRFFMRLRLGYPSKSESKAILDRFINANPFAYLESVADIQDISDAQDSYCNVKVNDAVKDYIVNIVEETKKYEKIALGISPRGCLCLMKASQVMAILNGRDYVIPDDVKKLAKPILAHRLILKGHYMNSESAAAESVMDEILQNVAVPLEDIQDKG